MKHCIWAVCCSVLLFGFLLVHADDDIAKAFIAKGDEALKKGNAEKALEFYQKAVNENPALPEVHCKAGEAYLKLGEKAKAKISFTKCIELIGKSEKLSPAYRELKRKAEQNLSSLEGSRKEGKIIEAEYAKELLGFAKRTKAKDNSLAKEALERVLIFDPNNAEAQKLMEEVRKSIVLPHWENISINTLDDWKPQSPDLWKIDSGEILTCDVQDSTANFREDIILGNEFKVSMEFKMSKSYRAQYAVGIIVGKSGESTKALAILDESVVKLISFTDKSEEIATGKLPDNFKKGEWNRLEVSVSGNTICAYINGKKALEYQSDKVSFKGGVGIWIQRCLGEFANIKYLK